jgi:hypothetical protein
MGRERTMESLIKTNEKKKNDNTLPMYITEINKNNELIGYRVCNHPKSKKSEKRFADLNVSLEVKRQLAIDYLDYLNNLDVEVQVQTRDLPKYIRLERDVGYFVKKPNYKTKYFTSSLFSKEENLQKAKEYLDSLK